MKAICYRQYGGPEVLKIENMPMPKPKDNQVLIKVMAAEITKGDCELRSFQFPVKWFSWALRLVWGIRKPRRPSLRRSIDGDADGWASASDWCRALLEVWDMRSSS